MMTRKSNSGLGLRLPLAAALLSLLVPLAAQSQRASSAQAQRQPRRPALVVGIVIDGLDFDKIEQYREFFGDNGFNRLLNNGLSIADLDYGSRLDETAATTVVFTGASPAVSGVTSAVIYDPSSRRARPVFLDPKIIGNFTDETYSPQALRVSNLSDELRIDTGALGAVHSISADPMQAIAMAGHSGNSAVWLTDDTGKWAGSTFYPEMPAPAQSINHVRPLYNRLDTLLWTPSIPEGAYQYLPSFKKIYSFRHTYPRSEASRYAAFKASAPMNSEITSLSTDYLRSFSLGKRESMDMLNINYSLQPYDYTRDADNRAELIDSYMRLDSDLARLFGSIDSQGPGMDHTLVFVVGTPLRASSRRDDEKFRLPSGEFSPLRALSLLKVNLMSIYGNGDWVLGYHDGQFYLNRDLIRERGKDLDEMRRESADFLRRMSGVTYSATIDEVISVPAGIKSHFPPSRNIDIETAGDVFIAVAPGWTITDETAPEGSVVVRYAQSATPAFILYPSVPATTVTTPVDARVIAPTVAGIMRIRAPNGAPMSPLRLSNLRK